MTPYGVSHLGKHCFGLWFVAYTAENVYTKWFSFSKWQRLKPLIWVDFHVYFQVLVSLWRVACTRKRRWPLGEGSPISHQRRSLSVLEYDAPTVHETHLRRPYVYISVHAPVWRPLHSCSAAGLCILPFVHEHDCQRNVVPNGPNHRHCNWTTNRTDLFHIGYGHDQHLRHLNSLAGLLSSHLPLPKSWAEKRKKEKGTRHWFIRTGLTGNGSWSWLLWVGEEEDRRGATCRRWEKAEEEESPTSASLCDPHRLVPRGYDHAGFFLLLAAL